MSDFSDLFTALDELITWRLFCAPHWFADRDACAAIRRRFADLGLWVLADDTIATTTALGTRIPISLISVFAGYQEHYDIPAILEDCGFINEAERENLFDRLEDIFENDPAAFVGTSAAVDALLRPVAQAAYRKFIVRQCHSERASSLPQTRNKHR